MRRSNSSAGTSQVGALRLIRAALLISRSGAPDAVRNRPAQAFTRSSRPTSTASKLCGAPRAARSISIAPASRPQPITVCPSRAKPSARARPRPRVAPVITIRLCDDSAMRLRASPVPLGSSRARRSRRWATLCRPRGLGKPRTPIPRSCSGHSRPRVGLGLSPRRDLTLACAGPLSYTTGRPYLLAIAITTSPAALACLRASCVLNSLRRLDGMLDRINRVRRSVGLDPTRPGNPGSHK